MTPFSPLLIGECLCDSCARFAGVARCISRFQSPPHRGMSLRRQATAATQVSAMTVNLSVPSSSGNVSATYARRPRADQSRRSFQSPPHRGCLCDAASRTASSSGFGHFQSPPHRGCLCDCSAYRVDRDGCTATAFSPLLIGDVSATSSTGASGACRLVIFQSPPHRGCLCDSTRCGRSARWHLIFQSPPHRGCLCDGTSQVGRCARASALSVPSSSGNVSATCAIVLDRGGDCCTLSVPSSSGMSLRLESCVDSRRDGTSCFQSPPHRGCLCDRGKTL